MLYRLHDETAEHNDVQKEYDDLKVEIYEAVHQIEALRPLPLGSRMLLYVVRKLTVSCLPLAMCVVHASYESSRIDPMCIAFFLPSEMRLNRLYIAS